MTVLDGIAFVTGGDDGVLVLSDMWTFDGASWSAAAAWTAPPRQEHAAAAWP